MDSNVHLVNIIIQSKIIVLEVFPPRILVLSWIIRALFDYFPAWRMEKRFKQ